MKITIRSYKNSDLEECSKIIIETFKKFNNKEGTKKVVNDYISKYNPKKENINNIKKNFSQSPIFIVAEINNKIIGFIRGTKNRIHNFYIKGDYHRKGIGRILISQFESTARRKHSKIIKVKSSLYASTIYERLGYKKTTGIRSKKGLRFQPMKKILK